MRSPFTGPTFLVVVLLASRSANAQSAGEDPLELRLDRAGLSDAELAATTDAAPRVVDGEFRVVSEPGGLGLRATRMLEDGPGVERRLCVAPCTTYLEYGAYRFSVENRRGRARDTPGTISLNFDGTLHLSMHSRRGARAAWYSTSVALVGSGLTLFFTNRERHFVDDPTCTVNCAYYTRSQKAGMTIGGLMTMFGLIAFRFGVSTRDTGVVRFETSPSRHHIDPDEAQ